MGGSSLAFAASDVALMWIGSLYYKRKALLPAIAYLVTGALDVYYHGVSGETASITQHLAGPLVVAASLSLAWNTFKSNKAAGGLSFAFVAIALYFVGKNGMPFDGSGYDMFVSPNGAEPGFVFEHFMVHLMVFLVPLFEMAFAKSRSRK
jgi:glucan phosphoethanolaminetransferase (alkaline phosphatase superfamily)